MHLKALCHHLDTLEQPLDSPSCALINVPPWDYLSHLDSAQLTIHTTNATLRDLWQQHGHDVIASPITPVPPANSSGTSVLCIYFASKFATENASTIARILQHPPQRLIVVIPNRQGGQRLKKDLQQLLSPVEHSSKAKCSIFDFTLSKHTLNAPTINRLAQLAEPSPITSESPFLTVPGIFSAEKIDTGSRVLAEVLAITPLHGQVADFGAGYGYLSHAALSHPRHKIKDLSLYELDHRALTCAENNLSHFPTLPKLHLHWHDITQALPKERPYDTIIMNPPFHTGHAADYDLGKLFIEQAAAQLKAGGTLYLVANIHLPYEKTIHALFRSSRQLLEKDNFKVISARK